MNELIHLGVCVWLGSVYYCVVCLYSSYTHLKRWELGSTPLVPASSQASGGRKLGKTVKRKKLHQLFGGLLDRSAPAFEPTQFSMYPAVSAAVRRRTPSPGCSAVALAICLQRPVCNESAAWAASFSQLDSESGPVAPSVSNAPGDASPVICPYGTRAVHAGGTARSPGISVCQASRAFVE